MYKIFLLLFVSFFFISCSLMQPSEIRPNEKAFDEEDTYVLFALHAEQIGAFESASKMFEAIYDKSGKKEYLYRSLSDDLAAKKSDQVITRVDTLLKDNAYDAKLVRLKVIALLNQNKLDDAIALAVDLSSKTKESIDYQLTSEIYIKRESYDLALKYLESAYAKEQDEKILDKMSIILYVNLNRKKEAIAQLETHSRMIGCGELVCKRLIAFYSNDNNIDGLLSTYLRLYEVESTPEIAQKIVQIYTYKKDYKNLIPFLEKSKTDDVILLQLYSSLKGYKKAYPLADKLYEQTLDINYLGQSAIFEYESAGESKSQELLTNVVQKLETVVAKDPQVIYMNYLGYILIDNDIDVKKGMKYIDKVLKVEPNSAFYLDSKAWGYYKLGECKKAKKLILKVRKLEGGDNEEVIYHLNEIKKCLKNKR